MNDKAVVSGGHNDQPEFRELGVFWAAIVGDEVVGVAAARVPKGVDFDDYKAKAKSMLECLSDRVKQGTLVANQNGERYFVLPSNSHPNRSKNKDAPPKPPKIFRVARHLA